MARARRINVSLTDQQRALLKLLAGRENRSESNLIATIVTDWLDRQEKGRANEPPPGSAATPPPPTPASKPYPKQRRKSA